MAFTLHNGTRGATPRVPFVEIATAILGARYDLSLALVGDDRAQKLNREYRSRDYIPNVLAFPLAKSSGEIVLNPRRSAKESGKYAHSEQEHLTYLFIHACLHLKGLDHGESMEREEQKYLKQFA